MKRIIIILILLPISTMSALAEPTDASGPWSVDASKFNKLSTVLTSPSTANKTIAADKDFVVSGPSSAPLSQHFTGEASEVFTVARTLDSNAAPVYQSQTTEAGKLGTELITNGTFSRSASGWVLSNFTDGTGISHSAGTVGTASQTITMQAYMAGLITISGTTTTAGRIDIRFNDSSLMDDTLTVGDGSYYFGVGPFALELGANMIPTTTSATFSITTNTAWAGSITSISLKTITPMPFTISQNAHDDLTGRIPQGIKFGRFNAGNIAIGDKETLAGIDSDEYGAWNIAIGARSQAINRTGFESTSVGAFALKNNNAPRNTAYGYSAGKLNTSGTYLTAIGYKSFVNNSTGNRNTGLGFHSAMQNSIGNDNTAIGYQALYSLATNSFNTAIGSQSAMNTTGIENTFVGALSGYLNNDVTIKYSYDYTTALGAESKVYGDNGTALGWQAQVGANGLPVTNSSAVGSSAIVTISNMVQLGNVAVIRFGFGSHSIYWGTTPPTAGTWSQGDRGFNSSTIVGSPKGWICTVGGTPGTWVSEGNL